MASEEHKELSDFIRSVHRSLREGVQECRGSLDILFGEEEDEENVESCWRKHKSDSAKLKKYAEAMKELATKYWEKNNQSPLSCRINWMIKECERYFIEEGAQLEERKEFNWLEKGWKVGESEKKIDEDLKEVKFLCLSSTFPQDQLQLLDVGSCYNPFSLRETIFKGGVIAIDLSPADDDVLKCDILDVKIGKIFKISEDGKVALMLPFEGFHAVALSLVLEYLPTSKMRYKCIKKCVSLLKPGGLLLIATPDSKHQTANSQMMKSWRLGFAFLGLSRVSYFKSTHLHLMSFRKSPVLWLPYKRLLRLPLISPLPPLQDPIETLFSIPQDVSSPSSLPLANLSSVRDEKETEEIARNFHMDLLASPDLFL